ncbi:FAD-binding oxidoreductase [Sulfitobacter albidus]|uniref:FAD-binding oxidoreductase n=1 Tax=Sulfitobacter albidus TaxID=2829501 RepID=A0A975PMC8_9RHOB|nr:FAD-binding oxidoreductase [Sulfitobacter albidus]QUJ76281.1 FAD-binding oxidoreductase [Sulfitobacter albidus]
MKRVFSQYAYGDGPRAGCWWDATRQAPGHAPFTGPARTDVAIIGAGFTGLMAALHLAQAGISVRVLDAQRVGWGASGRNGGFCCLGGGMASDAALDRRFGKSGRIDWRRTELAAIKTVEATVRTLDLEVDRHSNGETCLAHRPRDFEELRVEADKLAENYGVDHELIGPDALRQAGMAGPFHGGLTIGAGFGLNPRKYLLGLAAAAEQHGARLHDQSQVTALVRANDCWRLTLNHSTLQADRVIVATNGYGSDDLPPWLGARYLPSQSNVIVTRPLTDDEIVAQGWTTDQMAYDSRNLLHYFRLMPDRRFLFGMRGGLQSGSAAEARSQARIRRDFAQMFPAWRGVEITHGWSGMVSIARDLLPFVGAVPDAPGIFAGLCYHGNGVAMGSHAGTLLADLVRGKQPDRAYPEALRQPLRRFPFGRFRRVVMPFAYAGYALADL